MSETTTAAPVAAAVDFAALFPEEVVTKALVRDVTMPGQAGTMALVTLDNGFDHTKPNTFGPASIAGLQACFDGLRARAEAGEIQAVGLTGKPFIFAVGADLSGVPKVTQREQALAIARAGHAAYATLMDLPVPTFAFVNGAAMGGGVEIARELATVLAVGNKQPPPVGVLDPTLYRDDAWQKGPLAVEARTQLPGDIEGRRILLVDDVLYTGRTVRAALNVLMDFGRPAAVKLAVLLDRGGRELPVHAEVVGQQIVVAAQARVRLRYDASGRVQQVVVAGPAGD